MHVSVELTVWSAEKARIAQRLDDAGPNMDITSVLTSKQRHVAVELFRGIDADHNGTLSQEVTPTPGGAKLLSPSAVQEIEEACGNLFGLTEGCREAADEVRLGWIVAGE